MGDPALIFPTEDIGINDNLPNEDIHSANSRSPCLQVEKKRGRTSQGPLEEPIY